MPERPIPPETRLATVAASRALLTVGAVAGAVAALVAWAPVRRPAQHRTPESQERVDHVLRGAGATGPAREVWAWNPAFVTGDPGAEPLVRTFTWVAPTGGGGAPDGTVTVRQAGDGAGSLVVTGRGAAAAPGTATTAATATAAGATTDADAQDAALARALRTVAADEVVVADGGDWLAVRDDRVRPLRVTRPLLVTPTAVPAVGRSAAEHAAMLRDRAAHRPPEPVAPPADDPDRG